MRVNLSHFDGIRFGGSCCAYFRNCSAGGECGNCLLNDVGIGRFQFFQLFLQEIFVHIGTIFLNAFRQFFFQRRYIFRTRIKKFFCHIRIHICPDSAVLAEVKRFETLFQDFKNLLLRIFFFKSFQDTAKRFDFLEFSPDFFSHFLGQCFNPPGTAGRIDRTKHAKFFLQHDVYVSCDTAGEFITLAYRCVIRIIFIRINTADNCRENLGRFTKHIYTDIENRLGKHRRTGMDFAGTVFFFGAEGFHDIRPYLAGSTELGNFNVESGACIKCELQGLGNIMDIDAALLHFTDIFDSDSKSISHFLYSIRTAIGENIASDENGAELRRILSRPADRFRHFIIQFFQRLVQLSSLDQLGNRVRSDNTFHFADIFSLSLQCRGYQCQHTERGSTGIHHKRDLFHIKTVKQGMHIFQRGNAYAYIARLFGIHDINAVGSGGINTYIINSGTSVDFMLQKFIIFFRQRFIACLGNTPWSAFIAVHRCAAEKISHARIIICRKNLISC